MIKYLTLLLLILLLISFSFGLSRVNSPLTDIAILTDTLKRYNLDCSNYPIGPDWQIYLTERKADSTELCGGAQPRRSIAA